MNKQTLSRRSASANMRLIPDFVYREFPKKICYRTKNIMGFSVSFTEDVSWIFSLTKVGRTKVAFVNVFEMALNRNTYFLLTEMPRTSPRGTMFGMNIRPVAVKTPCMVLFCRP